DPLAALDTWATKGVAPDRIVAAHKTAGKVDRTRPLCPYPQVARRRGAGDIDDAASFSCVAPPR
ncbi:MAG TPA: tannase/feruloyl esterase family alpha/beta hydrolase, partial [Bryobacteraceae bacterium]|nr:tannase/feruloyl esterase family alpha/beta hydrolase [Bryobacteraceae bacterium]